LGGFLDAGVHVSLAVCGAHLALSSGQGTIGTTLSFGACCPAFLLNHFEIICTHFDNYCMHCRCCIRGGPVHIMLRRNCMFFVLTYCRFGSGLIDILLGSYIRANCHICGDVNVVSHNKAMCGIPLLFEFLVFLEDLFEALLTFTLCFLMWQSVVDALIHFHFTASNTAGVRVWSTHV